VIRTLLNCKLARDGNLCVSAPMGASGLVTDIFAVIGVLVVGGFIGLLLAAAFYKEDGPGDEPPGSRPQV